MHHLRPAHTWFNKISKNTYTNLTKANLLTVTQHCKLSATEAMSKVQIKKLVMQYFQEELLSKSSEILETGTMTGKELLQLKRLEFQEKEKEREAQLKLKELSKRRN